MNHGEQICFCRTSKNPKCDVCEKEQFILAGVTSGMKAGIAKKVLSNIYDGCRKRRQIVSMSNLSNWRKKQFGMLSFTRHQFSIHCETATWPTSQAKGDGRFRQVVSLRKDCKTDYSETELT